MKLSIHRYYESVLGGDLESIFTKRNDEIKDPISDYNFTIKSKLISLITPNETTGIRNNNVVNDGLIYDIKPKLIPTISVFGKVEVNTQGFVAEDIQCARKLRIYPTKEDKVKINKLFSISNTFYNTAMDGIMNNTIFTTSSKKHVRENCKVYDDVCETIHVDAKKAYFDTRSLAVMSAVSNCKAIFSNKREGNINHFHLSNKHSMQVVHFSDKNAKLRNGKFCIHDMEIELRNCDLTWLNEVGINQQVIVKKDKNKYYLVIPFKRHSRDNNKKSICAIDPGNRTFATYFSPDEIGKLGNNLLDKIKPIRNRIDNLKKVMKTAKSHTRYGMSRRIDKLNSKIINIIGYDQWKFANYLTKNFRLIFIPRLAKCVSKSNGKFTREMRRKINRDTRSLSHSKFIDKLRHLGKINGCSVVETREYYTTMTCSNCGKRNSSVGANKTFYCKDCKFTIDRDVNGAKNILIRSLTN